MEGRCTRACASDSDCSSPIWYLACGVGANNARMCTFKCGADSKIVCIDGVPTSCATLPETFCAQCSCPSGRRCEKGVGCMPLSDVGGPCERNTDCRTNNCSTFAHVCRVPAGQACSGAVDCDLCISKGSWSYCSRACDNDDDCNGGLCVGNAGTFLCHAPCGVSSVCPGKCGPVRDRNYQVCNCDDPECKYDAAKRDLGAACADDTDCRSGSCQKTVVDCDSVFGCWFTGWCSTGCTGDADCGAGLACVDLPCVDAQDPQCGRRCAPRCLTSSDCKPGTCRQLAGVGVTTTACDLRGADGSTCSHAGQCVSSRCLNGVCAPTGGLANGMSCASTTDCRSANCVNGVCRGQALIGDACAGGYDCAAGTCCPTGRCGTSC